MTPSIDQALHLFANLLPNWTLIPILTLLPNFGGFHRTLQRVRLANRGRLILRTPGPVPFGTCICYNVETILSWTCHVYGPFEFRSSLGTSILLTLKVIHHWKRQLHFSSSEPYLRQGISSDYATIVFICMGLLDLWSARTEDYKLKNSCRQWDSNPGPSAYEANTLSVELLELINIDHLQLTAFYLSVLWIVTCTVW